MTGRVLECSLWQTRKTAFEKPAAPAAPDTSRIPNAPYHQVLTGQPALVTGANLRDRQGRGARSCACGADVVVNYITHPETADEVVHEIEGMGRRAIALKADVSKEEDVEQMFSAAIAHFGTLHIVVSNAGLQRDAAFDEMTLEQWNTVLGVNLTGQFLCTALQPASSSVVASTPLSQRPQARSSA